MKHFALRSQRVTLKHGMESAMVEVKNGKIIAVHPFNFKPGCEVVDLGEKVLMPGLVDTHVHINEPGRTEWEGFHTATQAAAAGGITTVVDMPLNCIPATTTKEAFMEKLAAVENQLWVDCGFWGGVVPDNLEQLEELLESGVLGVKSFLIESGVDEFPYVQEEHVRKALPILSKFQLPYLIHAELELTNEHSHQDETDPRLYENFLKSRPKQWENAAIQLMIDLALQAQKNGNANPVHIVHLSSAEALEMIAEARSKGIQISTETCPHYLTIAAEQIAAGETLFKCCPPIRENENREALWQGIKDGIISFIVSDHSPCTPALKELQSGDITHAWGGIASLQFGLPLIWTEAKDRGFDLNDLATLMSFETAKFCGLDERKGAIAVGYDADLIVFDEAIKTTISSEMIVHRHKISPYVGREIQGQVLQTYLRGQLIYEQGKFVEKPLGDAIFNAYSKREQ